MTISTDLIAFVKDGLQRGIPKTELDTALRTAGWDRDQVGGALAQFADVEFVIPVPRPIPHVSTREAFMYILMFSTLYLSAYDLGSLSFDLINYAIPDNAERAYQAQYLLMSIRWSLASILVAFPVFLYMASLIGREIKADVTKRASSVRRQFTYLTLFIGCAVLMGDLTTMIYNFLGGELTARFLLKCATVAVIAGTGFGYFLRELRRDEHALSA